MFLSIIIPTYNDEKYLDECLGSCLAQDIPSDDYEIICVDDGSTDRTPQMLDDYAVRYPNISVIHKEHGGVGYVRNIGMEHAKGDYIWFVDHDDLLEENCLGFFRDKVRETGCDRLEFPYYDFFEKLSDKELRDKRNKQLRPETKNIHLVLWTSITKREFLLRNNIWPHSPRLRDREASYGVDCLYVKECMQASPKTITLSDRPYYFYRHFRGQTMLDYSESGMMLRINSQISFVQMYKEEYEEEIQRTGSPSFDRAMEYVVSARGCAIFMDSQNSKFRKICLQKMQENGFFPLKLPKIYTDTYSCWDCVKARNGMGPLLSIAFYYSCTPVGLLCYRILNIKGWANRLRASEGFRIMRAKFYKLNNMLFSGGSKQK